MAQAKISDNRKPKLEVGERIKQFRLAMGWSRQEQMAKEAKAVLGDGTAASRISAWENGGWNSGALAKVSLLHNSPRELFKWLREGGEMPRIHVDRDERGSDVHIPDLGHERALEAISTVNRCALLLAEILKRDDQDAKGEAQDIDMAGSRFDEEVKDQEA